VAPTSQPLRTAILLDTRALDAKNFSRSVAAIRLFIGESLQAESAVMLAEIDRGLKIRIPFTRDQEQLLQVVDSLTPSTVYNPLAPERLQADPIAYLDELGKQVRDLRQGISLLCYSLSGWPGRKHIVFFSEGYPLFPVKEVDRGTRRIAVTGAQIAANPSLRDPGVLSMVQDLVSLANTFGTSFYTIDARGLVAVAGIGSPEVSGNVAAGPGESIATRVASLEATETGPTEIQLASFQLTNFSNLDDAQNTLLALAGGTNGSAFFNTNDLGAVLRASTSEQNFKYLVSFAPRVKGKPRFRRLKVKTNRKGVTIRYQLGFTDFSDNQLLNNQLALAFAHPELFRYLDPVLQLETGPGQLTAIVGVHGDKVGAFPQQDSFRIDIVFAGQLYDDKGKPVNQELDIQKEFQVDLSGEQFGGLYKQPLLARQVLQLKPGKFRLVLVVVDRVSGSVGTTEQEFIIRG
jgi:VWFA-related protein